MMPWLKRLQVFQKNLEYTFVLLACFCCISCCNWKHLCPHLLYASFLAWKINQFLSHLVGWKIAVLTIFSSSKTVVKEWTWGFWFLILSTEQIMRRWGKQLLSSSWIIINVRVSMDFVIFVAENVPSENQFLYRPSLYALDIFSLIFYL